MRGQPGTDGKDGAVRSVRLCGVYVCECVCVLSLFVQRGGSGQDGERGSDGKSVDIHLLEGDSTHLVYKVLFAYVRVFFLFRSHFWLLLSQIDNGEPQRATFPGI